MLRVVALGQQAGGLVDDDQVGVLVGDGQGDVLGHGDQRLGLGTILAREIFKVAVRKGLRKVSRSITARVLEMLGRLGYRRGKPFIDDAVRYLFDNQEPEGCWFGRWGVNYVYGTWKALCGLIEVGVPAEDPVVVAGANWLLAHQQTNGGWGESIDSYEEPHLRGQG